MPTEPKSTTSEERTNTSRRDFVKTSALTGATAGLIGQEFIAKAAHAAGSDVIKVGLIGCGGRGNGAAKNAANADSGVRLTALCEMFPDRLATAKKILSRSLKDQYAVTDEQCFTGFDGYKSLMESDVDVVLLATPPVFRPDHLEAAVSAGKHIFCEKPIATDTVGVKRVLEISKQAEAKNLSLVSGLCWRYDLGVKATMERIFDGAIGDIVTIQENYLTSTLWQRERQPNWTEMHNQLANWLYYRWLSGDHISEQFIHSLDKSLWLHHDTPPARCYGMGGRQVRTDSVFGDVYDHFSVVYEWEDGTRTFAATRQMDGCFNETEDFVFGTKGTAKVLAHEISGENPWKYQFEGEGGKPSMYDLEHEALFASIRSGEPINNGQYMSYSTMMALMGREACYSGAVITWDDMMNSDQDFTPPAWEFGPAPEPQIHQPGSYKFA